MFAGASFVVNSKLGTEGVLVEADLGEEAGAVVDGEYVEAAGAVIEVAFGEKTLGGADYYPLLIGGDAEFRESGELFADGAGSDFDEGERSTVVTDEIDFTFAGVRSVVAGDEDVAETAKIPVSVGFAADAGLAGLKFAFVGGVFPGFAEAFACGDVEEVEDGGGEQGHGAAKYKLY
jgi:hypothetical protein